MKENQKIAHPLFIICLLILILNDWYFKTTYHNSLTGKLSDFAGLFAFPYLFSTLFPRQTFKIHVWTGILFVIWKSEFVQPIIDFLNSLSIPIHRTVDYTDNIALISVVISFFVLKSSFVIRIKPFLQKALIFIACLAFVATTLPPREKRKYVNIDKEYKFEFSKRELISRLNMIQKQELEKLGEDVEFDTKTNVYHYQGSIDTLAVLFNYEDVKEQDTIQYKTTFADILITGNEANSKLKLLTVYKIVPVHKDKDYSKKAIKQFEKLIVKQLKKNK